MVKCISYQYMRNNQLLLRNGKHFGWNRKNGWLWPIFRNPKITLSLTSIDKPSCTVFCMYFVVTRSALLMMDQLPVCTRPVLRSETSSIRNLANLPGISSGKYVKIRVWCIFMQNGLAISKNLLWTIGNDWKRMFWLIFAKMADFRKIWKI